MTQELRKQVQQVLDSDLSGYQIAKRANVPTSTIYRLRGGAYALDNLNLVNAEKIAGILENHKEGIDE